jgi:Phosphotransferase enzyme family
VTAARDPGGFGLSEPGAEAEGAGRLTEGPLAPAELLRRVENVVGSVAIDARLPHLATLTERESAARALAEAFEEPVEVLDIAIVRHRPGRRCTLRYELIRGRAAGPERIYAKTYASGRLATRVHRTLVAAADGAAASDAIRVAEPLGCLLRLHLVLQSEVEGTSATPSLLAGDEGLAARIAEMAFALHSSAAKFDRNHRLRHQLASLDARLGGLPPDLAARAREQGAAAAAALTPLRWRRRPVHRDFHEGQIVVDANGRLGLLDLDNAAISEPAADVATFLGRLRLLALKQRASSAAVTAAAAAFRTRYSSLDRRLDRRLLQALEAMTLLRLACREVDRGGPLASKLIDLSGAVLEGPASSV